MDQNILPYVSACLYLVRFVKSILYLLNASFAEIKSKLKNHYRAHRLSFWLNLVPDLHKPGSDDVPRSHHLLDAEQV